MEPTKRDRQMGLFVIIAVNIMWGCYSLYWKLLGEVDSLYIACVRITFGCLTSFLYLATSGGFREVREVFKDKKTFLLLGLAGFANFANWSLSITAVGMGRVMDTTIAGYLSPITTVIGGMLFFREKTTNGKKIAVVLSIAGIIISAVSYGSIPYLALGCTLFYMVYTFIKKTVTGVSAITSMFIELVCVCPVSIGMIVYMENTKAHYLFGISAKVTLLLLGAGVITFVSLAMLTYAIRRVDLAVVGFASFISPTMGFLLSLFVYKEPFTPEKVITFVFIWAALIIYSISEVRDARKAVEVD